MKQTADGDSASLRKLLKFVERHVLWNFGNISEQF